MLKLVSALKNNRLHFTKCVLSLFLASSSVRNKKAPLMQKTLAFMRGRLKR